MPLATYIDLFRLDGVDHYYLWQSDAEAGSFDAPIILKGTAPLTLSTEVAARLHEASLGPPVSEKPPLLHDLDTLAIWCRAPQTEGADYRSLGIAAGLLDRLGVLGFDSAALPGEGDSRAADLYEKLMCELAAANDREYAYLAPSWATGEPEDLGTVLSQAIDTLRAVLQRAV